MNWFTKIKNTWNGVSSKKEPPSNIIFRSQFPKEHYTHYWETVIGWENNEHTASVRFYPYSGNKPAETFYFHGNDLDTIKKQINSIILTQMKQYQR